MFRDMLMDKDKQITELKDYNNNNLRETYILRSDHELIISDKEKLVADKEK